jgi:sec-independent protein translocase protein TatB
MLDIGWQELFVIAVVALIVIGPKDLPRVLKGVMQWGRKARSLAQEFQSGLDDLAREAEVDDVKKEIAKAADYDLARDVEATLDPSGGIAKDLELKEVERTLDDAARGGAPPPALPKPDAAAGGTAAEPVPPAGDRTAGGQTAGGEPAAGEPASAQPLTKAAG